MIVLMSVFQKEVIAWAWDLLTNVYKIPKDRLYITYFGGTADQPADDEAKNLWLGLGLVVHIKV